ALMKGDSKRNFVVAAGAVSIPSGRLASWLAVHRNQFMDSQAACPTAGVKADNVEPLGDALMLLSGVLDQASSLTCRCSNTRPRNLFSKHHLMIHLVSS
ncbi:MAG: hypothetical protein AAGA21_25010, partial [Pseudomonadota bacterium]